MRVLVTGATGFLGTHLFRLMSSKHEVFGVTRTAQAHLGSNNLVADLSSNFDTTTWPDVDAVVHLAQASNYASFPKGASEVFAVAASATQRLLEYAIRVGAKRFVYASTGGLYQKSATPVKEADEISFGAGGLSHYFASKRSGELIVQSYANELDVTCARIFFCYGPGQEKNMLLPRLMSVVARSAPIQLAGRDGLRINPVFVGDAANVFQHLVENGGPQTLNVAGPKSISLREIGDVLGACLSTKPVFEVDTGAESPRMEADVSLMTSLFEHAWTEPADGLRMMVSDSSQLA